MLIEPSVATSDQHVVPPWRGIDFEGKYGVASIAPEVVVAFDKNLSSHAPSVLDREIFGSIIGIQRPGVNHLRAKRVHDLDPCSTGDKDGSTRASGYLDHFHPPRLLFFA
jgi:hypothetical protein